MGDIYGAPGKPEDVREMLKRREGITTSTEGIICAHPDFSLEMREIYQIRKNIFSKKDPDCLKCGFKCSCLKILMQPISKRNSLSARELYNSADSFLCQNCHIRDECVVNAKVALAVPRGGWVEDYNTNIRGIGGGEETKG